MRLRVTIHAAGLPWHKRYAAYLVEGFRKHGIIPRVTSTDVREQDCDLAVLLGPNYWKKIERADGEYLMLNRKFIGDVNDNVTISWNGFNGRGQFCVDEVKESRLRPHIFDIEPWTDPEAGGHTLLLGQFDLGRCGKYATLQEWHSHVKINTGDKILLRQWPGNSSLKIDCYGARLAVSLNSTVAIETVLLGVPTVTMDEGSPAWPVCAHHMGHVRRSDNRLAWLEYLSNCQWNYKQIQNGDFWRQLHPRRGPRLCDVEF